MIYFQGRQNHQSLLVSDITRQELGEKSTKKKKKKADEYVMSGCLEATGIMMN